MGLILIFILIVCTVSYLSYLGADNEKDKKDYPITGALVSGIILSVVVIAIISNSYTTSIELREKLAVIEQYQESVELYAEKGVAEFRPGSASSKEFTDLKYNQYQEQIGKMIRELRDTIVSYNIILAGKQAMASNWIFDWVIILPDDMKPVKMADYLK